MEKIQNFLPEVDEHEKTDFLVKKFFVPVIFWSMISWKMDQKLTGAKKVKIQKNHFFMPVNHEKKFLKSVHTVDFFSWLFSETLNFYFKMGGRFFKKILGSNHYYWLVLWLVKWAPESKNLASPLLFIGLAWFFF